MIELEGVGRVYGRGRRQVAALRDVSLRVEAGTVVAVVGPNGAGKSTLFALALGFVGPTAGRVTIEGADPRVWIRERGVGYLPERFGLPADWPVGRALRALAALEARDAGAAANAALARWGLEEVSGREVGSLSRGTLQRVGLAQATLAEHALVVLDEPSEGLDPLWRIRLRDELKRLRAAGATVLLASHDLEEVERVADRVVLLDRGQVVETVEQAQGADMGEWRLRLGAAFDVGSAFPDAVAEADGREYRVRAEGGPDLSARLAALLAQGAVIESVTPETAGLEARVRRALDTPDG